MLSAAIATSADVPPWSFAFGSRTASRAANGAPAGLDTGLLSRATRGRAFCAITAHSLCVLFGSRGPIDLTKSARCRGLATNVVATLVCLANPPPFVGRPTAAHEENISVLSLGEIYKTLVGVTSRTAARRGSWPRPLQSATRLPTRGRYQGPSRGIGGGA